MVSVIITAPISSVMISLISHKSLKIWPDRKSESQYIDIGIEFWND